MNKKFILVKNLYITLSIISGSGVLRRVTIRLIIGSGVASLIMSIFLRGGETTHVEHGTGFIIGSSIGGFARLKLEDSVDIFGFNIFDSIRDAFLTTTFYEVVMLEMNDVK
jgi:hypothetical protein